jgi:hypothetical protein
MITYDRLKLIIPSDQALACKALATSLQQLKNINNSTLPQLGAAYVAIETTANLGDINALTQPIPSSTANFYANTYATGSGPNGTLYLTDVIGFPVGGTDGVYSSAVSNIFTTMNVLQTGNKFTTLQGVYDVMYSVNTGVYGNPVTGPIIGVPGAGNLRYANATVCYANLLLPEAVSATNSIVSSNPNAVANLNSETTYLAASVVQEVSQLFDVGVDLFNLGTGGRLATTSFVQSIGSDYGKDQTLNGPAWYLEQVTDTGTLAGQSVIAVMREGRNTTVLADAGIGLDALITDVPQNPPGRAPLVASTISESEAANAVIQ